MTPPVERAVDCVSACAPARRERPPLQTTSFRAIPSARPAPEGPVTIRSFLETHFRHFNAATLVDAARAYGLHIDGGGRMLVPLAGVMSTGELGSALAGLLRRRDE